LANGNSYTQAGSPAPKSSQIANRQPSSPPVAADPKEPAGHIRLVAAEEPAPEPKNVVVPPKKDSRPASAPHVVGKGTAVKPQASAETR
jgi:hypothetical protein